MVRISAEDTTLSIVDVSGNKVTIPVPQNSKAIIHLPGLHYNRAFLLASSLRVLTSPFLQQLHRPYSNLGPPVFQISSTHHIARLLCSWSRPFWHLWLGHCAARYWEDPHTFNPERFFGDWPRDAFMPFGTGTYPSRLLSLLTFSQKLSSGPRACLGKR